MSENNNSSSSKNNNAFFIIVIAILSLVILGMIIYIAVDKDLITFSREEDVIRDFSNDGIKNKVTTNINNEVNACIGTYYGEFKFKNANGVINNYKYMYTLNNDYSYTASINGNNQTGTYNLNNGMINFNYNSPSGVTTSSYNVSSDCSYFVFDNTLVKFNIVKQ